MKERIVVIGGGVGAVTAVWGIVQQAGWQDRYEITVHQLGWRLGGKGASGRNLEAGGRIEEHGLHVWAGFYENAFRHMRACYARLAEMGLRARDAPLGTFEQAFRPLGHLFLAEHVDGEWKPWIIDLPTSDELPGEGTEVPGPWPLFLRALATLHDFLETGAFTPDPGADPHAALAAERLRPVRHAHARVRAHAHAMSAVPERHYGSATTLLSRLIRDAQDELRRVETPEHLAHDGTRRAIYLADLGLAFARGMAESEAFTRGYDVLDQWEFTEWLRMNGAGENALNSVLLRGCYDFVFGFPAGDIHRGNAGAGTAVRAMGRLILAYRGAVFWQMQAGMGDTIFAPYYQVLSALGVRFEFFSGAIALRPGPDGTGIDRIEMVRQARPKGGTYDPLIEVRGLPCWPSQPLWDRLEDGERLKSDHADLEAEPPVGEPHELLRERDFDTVVLGASIGSLPYLTADLAALSPRWRRMLAEVGTVGTHAAQFWLTRTADEMGWRARVTAHNPAAAIPDGPLRTMITGFAEPLDTWADMSHLLAREDWTGSERGAAEGRDPEHLAGPARVGDGGAGEGEGAAAVSGVGTDAAAVPGATPADAVAGADPAPVAARASGPVSIAYFCAPAPDGETLEEFKADLAHWTRDALPSLWPAMPDGDPLYPPGGGLEAQYARVNMHGSERYVLSTVGSVYHRLAPDESGFDNLVLAGDWTRCGLNAGCVEAATMSGLAAANAVTGGALPIDGAEDLPAATGAAARAMTRSISATAAAWPLDAFYAKGRMAGWFLFYALPREAVAALLPPDLHLGVSSRVAPGMHPVGLSFCRYEGVRGSFLPDALAMPPYGEATFAIPNVVSDRTGRAQLLYPRRLYVDRSSAIAAGRIWYAMDKAFASITQGNHRFAARNARGLAIEASFERRADPVPAAGHPGFGAIDELLGTAFVTRRESGRGGGQLLYNAFNLELSEAWIAPVSARVTVSDPDPRGFPAADLAVTPLAPGAEPGLPGAFRIWCSWSMTNPFDSARVARAAEARAWLRTTY